MEVRLSDGRMQGAGTVEMRLGGEWGAVCDTRFDDFDAQVSTATVPTLSSVIQPA